jgi:hypothetical protein
MTVLNSQTKLFGVKIACVCSGIKPLCSNVYGICTRFDRRKKALYISCGSKQLGQKALSSHKQSPPSIHTKKTKNNTADNHREKATENGEYRA